MAFMKEAPVLSAISKTASTTDLRVRHGGYDVKGAEKDPNVAFPLDLFRELEQKGEIGSLADTAFSFVGACSQKRLLKATGPKWVEKLKTMNIDAVFFVPV
jgi:glycine/betaine/sarcosine/D-proline reductase family selenoprotein B